MNVFAVCVFLCTVLGLSSSQSECPNNEESVECVDPCNKCNAGECVSTAQCVSGCDCISGTTRNSDGKCVPKEYCNTQNTPSRSNEGQKCGRNERYSDCVIPCNDCEIRGNCEFFACNKGCDCIDGYYRDGYRNCIPKSQCPPKGSCRRDEQYYDCTPSCKNTCKNYNNPAVRCACGEPSCFCREGLVKAANGTCIPPNQCPGQTCGRNEKYSDCVIPCNDCEIQGKCAFFGCNKGCDCIDGYYRDKYGNCIPKSQCPPKGQCGAYEVFLECGSACPPTCSNLGEKNQACTQQCVRGCFCQDGYVRDPYGKCVRPENCNQGQCGPYEVFLDCGSACPPKCSNLGVKNQPCTLQCVRGCFCQDGYVKDQYGNCVRPENCYQEQCGPREVFLQCGSACPPTCSNRGENQVCTQQCVKGCFCQKGFVRDPYGRCVTPESCNQKQCGPWEVFLQCGSACPPTCGSRGMNQVCSQQCVKGCFCQKGLVRNRYGFCVKPESCNQGQCGSGEVYKLCGSTCPPTCSNLGENQLCSQRCVEGCFCKDGLVRRGDGKCVPPERCNPGQCGPYEEFLECGSACPPTCSNRGENPDCSQQCVRGCFCQKGYVKNGDGKCVRPESCNQGQCKPGEVFLTCGTSCPITCNNRRENQLCSTLCVKGCFCKDGLIRRDSDGECVRPENCPRQCRRPGEVFLECGSSCPLTCNNRRENQLCTKQCVRGCFCGDGLVRSENGDCIRPENCPPACGPDEEYLQCGSACPPTCDYLSANRVCTLQCVSGCFCKRGLMRKGKKCVKPENCYAGYSRPFLFR